jgi:hypothetical protein
MTGCRPNCRTWFETRELSIFGRKRHELDSLQLVTATMVALGRYGRRLCCKVLTHYVPKQGATHRQRTLCLLLGEPPSSCSPFELVRLSRSCTPFEFAPFVEFV